MKKKPTQKQIENAKEILGRARAWEQETNRLVREGYVGKYFRFLNTYGGTDQWWMYGTFTHVDDTGTLRGWTIQRTSLNVIELEMDARCEIFQQAKLITKQEFDFAVKTLYTEFTDHIAECLE